MVVLILFHVFFNLRILNVSMCHVFVNNVLLLAYYVCWFILSDFIKKWRTHSRRSTLYNQIIVYQHKPLRKIKLPSPIARLTLTLLVAWCLIWWFASIEKSMVVHDTECPYWDQVSLNNTTQERSPSYGLSDFRYQHLFEDKVDLEHVFKVSIILVLIISWNVNSCHLWRSCNVQYYENVLKLPEIYNHLVQVYCISYKTFYKTRVLRYQKDK